jgi:hypothetical protein
MNKTAAITEAIQYIGSFALIYLTSMVAAHGPTTFVLDYGCLVAALSGVGLFTYGSQRTPPTIFPPKP